jgi:hypothetical protein
MSDLVAKITAFTSKGPLKVKGKTGDFECIAVIDEAYDWFHCKAWMFKGEKEEVLEYLTESRQEMEMWTAGIFVLFEPFELKKLEFDEALPIEEAEKILNKWVNEK